MSPNGSASLFSLCVILVGLLAMTAPPCAATITFTDIGGGLPSIFEGATVWGDYDGDGDLDLLLSGYSNSTPMTRIYAYMGGVFTYTGVQLQGVEWSAAAWGDYDNDGDLDLLLLGSDGSGDHVTKLYRNEGVAGFSDIAAGLLGLAGGPATWADYDNDGDLDILISGQDDAAVPRTNLYRNDGSGIFTPVDAGFVQLDGSSAAWGDYDNDGDLDLALCGFTQPHFEMRTHIYRNDGGAPAWTLAASLVGAGWGSVAWADQDCDGDLDLLVTGFGQITGTRHSTVYRNDGAGVFTDAAAGLTGLGNSAASWGDYDNDGDPDILLGGVDLEDHHRTFLYRNDGAGGYTELATPLLQLGEGTVAWGDYDGDGDLDIVESGRSDASQIHTAVFRSSGATANTPPSTPPNLTSTIQGDRVVLSWSASTDAQTPAACLTYNLRIGTVAGGSQIMSPMAGSSGQRRIVAMGNSQERTSWTIDVRAVRYFWTVQAIDGAFAGSPFAAEHTIQLSAVEGATLNDRAAIRSIVPNPSSRTTEITITLSAAAQVRLAIYDAAGRRIRLLLDRPMEPGTNRQWWDGTNDRGLPVGSGFYLCRLEADSFTAAKSILRID